MLKEKRTVNEVLLGEITAKVVYLVKYLLDPLEEDIRPKAAKLKGTSNVRCNSGH